MRENKFLKEMMETDRSRFESLMQKQEAERRATAQQMQDMQVRHKSGCVALF
jgi:hypothetical protein